MALLGTTNERMTEQQEKAKNEGQSGSEHVEVDPDLKNESELLLKSSLDDLGLWTTVKRFRKVRRYRAPMPSWLLTEVLRLSLFATSCV